MQIARKQVTIHPNLMSSPKTRADFSKILRDRPHKPGVYVMRDRLDHVIYVGKARDLRRRVGSYFMPSRKFSADLKTRALIDSVWNLEYHIVRSDAEAVLFEGRLIKEFRPKYNVSFRDDKRFLLVRVHLADPFPRFSLTRLKKDDGARYFGPFAHAGALRATIEAVKRKFGIRSCRPAEPDEKDYKHCLDHVIKNCSAPCIARIDRAGYLARVEEACAFLDGQSREFLGQIETEMKAAAERMEFEKAVQLRNLLEDLKTTTRPMVRFTRKSLPTTIDPTADLAALRDALQLPKPPEIMECFDISNISSTHIVASMVRFRNGVPDRSNYRTYRITGTDHQDDFASMAEVVRRRYGRVLREQETVLPDLVIVDGGRGQLSSARKELERLKLSHLPIIGLAKEFEEIHRPGRPLPMRLPEDSGALRLLQRIRDEAHRTANGFHSLLLKKRVRESLLDSIPGMGSARKRALLERFGSVERIKALPAKDLAEVPGISQTLAEKILSSLQSN